MAGGKAKGRKKREEAASSSRTRKQQQEFEEAEMENAVEAQMRKVKVPAQKDNYKSHLDKATLDASMRSKLKLAEQHSIASLPRFQLDMHCTPEEMDNFFDDRNFRYQLVSSFALLPGLVATPPDSFIPHQLIEIMKKVTDENGQVVIDEDGQVKKRSVMQFVVNEFDNYLAGYRPTPPGEDRQYEPDGFFIFENLSIKLPSFFGKCFITGHKEDYVNPLLVQRRPGFLELMVERLLRSVTMDNYKFLLLKRSPDFEGPMLFFGECQRSLVVQGMMRGSIDGPFGLITDPLDRSFAAKYENVTVVIDKLIHKWSGLSKVGLWLFLAILELAMGLESDALFCFIKGRVFLRCLEVKLGREQVILDLYDENGVFSLKKLLGQYLILLKYEEAPVLRCIMRKRTGYTALYDRRGNSSENIRLKGQWASPASDLDFVEDVDDVNLPYRADKVEWERWRRIKAQLRGDETLLGKLMS